MPRTDNDSWDLASSVGATATGVAASRALATRSPTPLIVDIYAEPLVRAVGVDYFTKLANGLVEPDEQGNLLDPQRLADGMAIRTKYFDDFFATATDAGIHQAVILAAGLDARPYRLPWPDGTTVFELDQPAVVDFKSRTFTEMGVPPTATLHSIGIDLRDDWPAALRAAGFAATVPTAWIAEGLLGYLPPQAQDRLFDDITALSAAGSRVATDWQPDMTVLTSDGVRAIAAGQRANGLDLDDPSELTYQGQRSSVVDYLNAKGWQTTTVTVEDVFLDNGLEFRPDEAMTGLFNATYTSARLS
ncbi:MAG: SAM-dependent methyltransferase [Mycobacterium sp.]